MHVYEVHAYDIYSSELHIYEMHGYEVYAHELYPHEIRALDMHTGMVLGNISRSPTLQTVVRWSICRDLSCKIRVFTLRD
jgi:hypothetical protein